MKINKAWHEKHKMLKNPSHEQRMKWHIAHSKNCNCYPITSKLQKEIENYKKM